VPGSADAAASRCVSFADDFDSSAGVLAFVSQHLFEHPQATVQYGFCHPCFDQLQAAHIALDMADQTEV
jgi:hypothetical protein